MTTEKLKIGFLGTGLMGEHMARNLLRAGHQVTAWNRTIEKAETLRPDGARIASSAHDAVLEADMVVTMLADGATVAEVMFAQDVAGAMKSGAVLVDMSSIKPEEAREHAQKMQSMGLNHLDAPVSGGTKGAEAGSLAIMAGGDKTVFEQMAHALGAMGRPVHVGPDGAGQLSKLANQTIVAVTIGVVAEAILLAEKGGADPAAICDALKGGFADSVILQQHGHRMIERNFVPGGLSKFQLKDVNNALNEAQNHDLSLPLTAQIQERYTTLVKQMDGADLDHAALYLELLERQKK